MGFFSDMGEAMGFASADAYTRKTADAQKYKTAEQINDEANKTAEADTQRQAANTAREAAQQSKQSMIANARQMGGGGLSANLMAASNAANNAASTYADTANQNMQANKNAQMNLSQQQDAMQQDANRAADQAKYDAQFEGKNSKRSAMQATGKAILDTAASVAGAMASDKKTKSFCTGKGVFR